MIRRIGEVNETQNIPRIERDSERVKASITETSGSKRTEKELFKINRVIITDTYNDRYNVSNIIDIYRNNICNDNRGFLQTELSSRAGAVAQLGEHHTCTVGVAGSIPVSSTIYYYGYRNNSWPFGVWFNRLFFLSQRHSLVKDDVYLC